MIIYAPRYGETIWDIIPYDYVGIGEGVIWAEFRTPDESLEKRILCEIASEAEGEFILQALCDYDSIHRNNVSIAEIKEAYIHHLEDRLLTLEKNSFYRLFRIGEIIMRDSLLYTVPRVWQPPREYLWGVVLVAENGEPYPLILFREFESQQYFSKIVLVGLDDDRKPYPVLNLKDRFELAEVLEDIVDRLETGSTYIDLGEVIENVRYVSEE